MEVSLTLCTGISNKPKYITDVNNVLIKFVFLNCLKCQSLLQN